MAEIEPAPITEDLQEQFHKLLAIAMFKRGERTMTITADDLKRFDAVLPDGCIVARLKGGVMNVRLVTAAEAERLASIDGMPVYGD